MMAVFVLKSMTQSAVCLKSILKTLNRMQHTLLPPLLLDEFITNPGDPPRGA